MRPRVLLGLAALAAGCIGAAETVTLGGAFTEAATQEDLRAFGDGMRALGRGVDVAILESFPPQFMVRELPADRCDEARAFAQAEPYVARVGECQASR